jgi:hypothetical protein
MPKKTLNGYWTSKENKNLTVYVERVFKKGYVTGFSYLKTDKGEVIGRLKCSHDELKENYIQKKYDN